VLDYWFQALTFSLAPWSQIRSCHLSVGICQESLLQRTEGTKRSIMAAISTTKSNMWQKVWDELDMIVSLQDWCLSCPMRGTSECLYSRSNDSDCPS
jgi:hypothetical protein